MAEANLHLEAADKSKRVEELLAELISGKFNSTMHGEVAQLIRFFGKNIAKLQECNDAVLKIAQMFFLLSDKEKWSKRDAFAFLLTITTMMLKRNDDLVIRKLCVIMIEFAKLQTTADLKTLVMLHQKAALMIFHKLSKVSTSFTQGKLLDVLNLFLKVLDDGGKKTITSAMRVTGRGHQMSEEAFRLFELVDSDNFTSTSHDFLSFYNTKIVRKVFTARLSGFFVGINGKKTPCLRMFADFNMRNLSIAFHVSSNAFLGNASTEFCFVEMEECEVEAKTGMFEDPEQIDVTVTPTSCQILDANDQLIDAVNIESVKLAVIDEGNDFMSSILPRFKDKQPMILDNMTENESLNSFHTANFSIANATLESRPMMKPQQHDSADTFTPPQCQSQLPSSEPVQVAIGPEMKRRTAKIEPAQIEKKPWKTPQASPKAPFTRRLAANPLPRAAVAQSIYNEVPHDAKPPPLRQFMQQQRFERQAKKQQIQSGIMESSAPENSEDVDWKPPGAKKTPGAKQRSPPKKRAPAKKRASAAKTVKQETKKPTRRALDYSNDLEDGVLEMFGEAFEKDEEVVRAPVAKKRQIVAHATPKAKLPMTKAEQEAYDDAEDAMVMSCLPSERQKAPTKKIGAAQSKAQPKAAVVTIEIEDEPVVEMARNTVCRKRPAPDKEFDRSAKTIDEWGVVELPSRQQMLPPNKPLASPAQRSFKLNASEGAIGEIQSKAIRPVSVQQKVNDGKKQVEPAPKFTTAVPKGTKNAFDSLLDNKENMPAPLKPEATRPQQKHKDPEVVLNLELLKHNKRLESFLKDSESNAGGTEPQQEEVIEEEQYGGDNYVVRTQTIQKKTSPTTIRTVQIQEINFSPSQSRREVASPSHNDNSLAQIYEEKAGEVIGPILDEFYKMDLEKVAASAETEKNFRHARAEIVEAHARLVTHAKEHVKLLKRLQHSKRNLIQLRDIHSEKSANYVNALKQEAGERRQAIKKRAQRIKEIPAEVEAKEKEIKKEIWRGYVESVANNIQDMLKSYSDI